MMPDDNSYVDLLERLRRDLHLDLSTDVQPNSRLVLPDPVLVTPTAHWSNYGSGFEPLSFYVDNVSRVHLSGTLQGSASVTTGEWIFTLPPGYRPAFWRAYPEGIGAQRIDVTPAGIVVYEGAPAAHIISLDAISFRAYQ